MCVRCMCANMCARVRGAVGHTELICHGWPPDDLRPGAAGVFMPAIRATVFRMELKHERGKSEAMWSNAGGFSAVLWTGGWVGWVD